MDRVEKPRPWRDHENWRDSAFRGDARVRRRCTTAEFRHTQRITPDGVVRRVASVSHVAVLPARRADRGARRGPRCARHAPRPSPAARTCRNSVPCRLPHGVPSLTDRGHDEYPRWILTIVSEYKRGVCRDDLRGARQGGVPWPQRSRCRCRVPVGYRSRSGGGSSCRAAARRSSVSCRARPARPRCCSCTGGSRAGGLNWFQAFEPLADALPRRRARSARPRPGCPHAQDLPARRRAPTTARTTIDALDTGPVIAVGYSMGGPVVAVAVAPPPRPRRRARALRDRGRLLPRPSVARDLPVVHARATVAAARAGVRTRLLSALPLVTAAERHALAVGRERDAAPRLADDLRGRATRSGRTRARRWISEVDVPTAVVRTTEDRGVRVVTTARARRRHQRRAPLRVADGHLACGNAGFAAPLLAACPTSPAAHPLTDTRRVRPRPTIAAARGAPTARAPSRATIDRNESESRTAIMMCPVTTIMTTSHVESCTNVAPVRQLSENGSYQRMIEPVISITHDRPRP